MSKKKKGKKKPSPTFINQRLDEATAVNDAAFRVNTVIQKMTEPPETVLAHLKRIGIEPIIDQMVLDDDEPKTYVVFEYQQLLELELQVLQQGHELYGRSYNPAPVKTATEPILLDEIRRRIQQVKETHPSQMTLDDMVYEDDEWPITGENPL